MRYSSYGNRDSQHAVEGDMSFVRMVSRINPEDLKPGEVALSYNGRMENGANWTVRHGAEQIMDEPNNWVGSSTGEGGICYYYDSDGYAWIFSQDGAGVAVQQVSNVSAPISRLFMFMPTTILNTVPGALISKKNLAIWFNGDDTAPMQFTGNVNPLQITTATRTASVVTVTTSTAHGLTAGEFVSVFATDTFITSIDGRWEVASTPTSTTFTFAQVAADEGPHAQPSTAGACYTFSFMSTTPTVATSDDDVTMTVSDGLCTISRTSHTRSSGDVLTIYDGGGSGLVEGDKYEVKYIDANSYSINAEIPDGTYTVTLGGKQPISGGYISTPKAYWGVFHENRLVVPYDSTGNAGRTDEIVFSDILDYETFDPIVNQLRFGVDSEDFVQNYIPITADRAVVLCNRSIHLLLGISGSLNDLTRYEISREIGCIAPLTATFANGKIMFLSMRGLVTISLGESYDLYVDPIPLSSEIHDQIDRYLKRTIIVDDTGTYFGNQSHAVYSGNRYYLFVTDSDQQPNTAFIYNFLNGGWESKDLYGTRFCQLIDIPGANRGTFPNLGSTIFARNETGYLYRLDSTVDAVDEGPLGDTAIDGELTTRAYAFGSLNHKRFTRCSFGISTPFGATSTLTASAITITPDSTLQVYSATPSAFTDQTVKARIGARGRSVQLKFEWAEGTIESCSVDAVLSSLNDVTRA